MSTERPSESQQALDKILSESNPTLKTFIDQKFAGQLDQINPRDIRKHVINALKEKGQQEFTGDLLSISVAVMNYQFIQQRSGRLEREMKELSAKVEELDIEIKDIDEKLKTCEDEFDITLYEIEMLATQNERDIDLKLLEEYSKQHEETIRDYSEIFKGVNIKVTRNPNFKEAENLFDQMKQDKVTYEGKKMSVLDYLILRLEEGSGDELKTVAELINLDLTNPKEKNIGEILIQKLNSYKEEHKDLNKPESVKTAPTKSMGRVWKGRTKTAVNEDKITEEKGAGSKASK